MKKALLLLTMCFMALSNAFGAVTWYLNEDFESGQIPSGWTQEVVSSNVANWVIEPTTSATYPASGNESNYYVALRNNTGMDQHYVTKLITPAIDFTVGEVSNPQLVFNHAQVGVGQDFDTLKVYSRANASAPWILLRVFSSRVDVWTIDTVALTGFTNASAYQIGFEAVENMGRGIVVDDVRIMNASQCVMPSGIEMVVPGTTSVKLTWNGDLMADTFEVVLSKVAIVDWSSYTAAFHGYSTDFEIEATGLEHSTTYFAYVRSNCNDNETGWTDWAMGTFRTRARMELPYVQGFAQGLPDGWSRGTYWNASKPTFPSSSLYSYSVDSTTAMVFSAILANGKACAITPEVNLPSLQGVEVSFWGTAGSNVKTPGNSSIAQLYVGVMNDPEDSASLVIVDSVEVKVANKHQRFDVSLAGYNGNGLYLAFLVGNPTRTSYFYLDSLVITRPNAFVPAVKLSNATPDGFDVNVDLKGASSWNLRIARAADYKHKNVLPSSFILSQDGLTGNTFHVSGNYGDSILAVYVQGVKAAGVSAWSFPVALRVPGAATLPLAYEFETEGTLPVKSLDNEFTANLTAKTYSFLYFPLVDQTNFYPKYATSSPKYNNGNHVLLQGIDQWMTLPYIESFAGKTLSFQLAAANPGESRVAVGVMVDPYDLSTFTQLATFEGPSGSYLKCEVDLDGTAPGHYLAFVAIKPEAKNATTGSVNHIDAIHLDETPSCREAVSVAATDDGTTLNLTWATRGMSNWLVELFAGSNSDSLLSVQNVEAPAVTFDSLDVLTSYYYRINTICGSDTLIGENKLSYKTGCEDIATLPWTENFDSYSVGSSTSPAIDCWTWINANEGSYPYVYVNSSTNYVKSGTRSLYFVSSSSLYAYIVLPKFAAPLNTLQIQFSHREESATNSGILEVGYVTNKHNASTFVSLATFERSTSWQTEEVMLLDVPVNVADEAYLVFRYGGGSSNYYMGIDDITIDVIPSCPRPRAIVVDTVTSSTATLSWTPGMNETQWQYICSSDEAAALDWTNAPIIGTPSVQLNGLGGCSNYTFYVRAYCSSTDQSEVSSKAFQTAAGVIHLPFVENFNNLSVSGEIPPCWDNSEGTSSATYSWCYYISSYSGNGNCEGAGPDGSNCIRFDSYMNSAGNTNVLKTPKILLDQAARLSFYWKNPAGGDATVYISTETDTTRVPLISSGLTSVDSWTEKVVDLSAYTGETVTIYFEGTSNYGYGDANLYLDNVKVATYDVNCAGLSDLRATASSPTDVSVFWTAGGMQEVTIEVSDSANFVNPTVYAGITDNPFVLDQLAANHHYYIRGRQSCDAAGDWIETSAKTLCAAVTPEELGVQTFGEGISALDCWSTGYTIEGVNASMLPTIGTSTAHGKVLWFDKDATRSDTISYQDGLYAIMPQLDIDSITKYEVVFNAFAADNAEGNAGKLSVGVITDPSDFSTFTAVQTLKLDYAADSISEKTYTVSFKDYVGDYNDDYGKYIVFMAQSGDSANSVAIDNVEVTLLSNCAQVSEGTISNVTTNSAVYSWPATDASAYEVFVLTEPGKPTAVSEPVFQAVVQADSVVITGISPVSNYYASVRALCDGDTARWSAYTAFRTECGVISSYPWKENFESYQGSTYGTVGPKPHCWETLHSDTTKVAPHVISASVSSTYCYTHDGVSALSFYGSGNCYAVLPEFADALSNLELSFWFQTESNSNGELTVGYITEQDTAMETFHAFASLGRSYGEMTFVDLYLDSIPAEAHRLVFKWNYSSQYSCCIDDITVNRIPACKAPASIKAKAGRRYIDVTLAPKDGYALSNCELVCSATALSKAQLDTAAKILVDTTGIYRVKGLERETTYYLYARANCGAEDGVSDWISTTVTTRRLSGCGESTVGEPQYASSYLPTYNYYDYSMTEQIYTPGEVGDAGEISTIAFYNQGATHTRTIDIYMAHTDKDEFNSTTDWVSVGAGDKVYSGSVTFTANAWTTLQLTQNFNYNGNDNLLLVVDDNTGSYSTSPHLSFYTFTCTGNQALYKYRDNDDMNPGAMGTIEGTFSAVKNVVQFMICVNGEACPNVADLSVELVGDGTSEAIVRWNSDEDDYISNTMVILSDSAITDFTNVTPTFANAPTDSIDLTGLNPETSYYVYVRAVCQAEGVDEGTSGWVGTTFTTLANCPAVTNLTSNLSNAANAVSVSWIPAFADQAQHFAYVFSTDSLDAAALASAEKNYVNDTLAFELTNLVYDETYYIYVASVCGNSFSPWSKTVIKTDAACAPARNLAVTRLEHNRVVLSWNPSRFGAENQWEAGVLGDSASAVIVSDTAETVSAMIIGLTPETQYTAYVRTLCADGSVSEMATLPFSTSAFSACTAVGSGSSTSSYLPTYNYYNYSYTQQIYTPEELGRAGEIISIAFYNAGTEKTRSLDVYLTATNKSAFESTSDWEPVATADKLFTGNVVFVEDDWTVITLNAPFDYDGFSNLLVTVADNTGSYSSSPHMECLTYTGDGYQALYKYQDSGVVDPGTTSATSRSSSKNQIQFCMVTDVNCSSIADLAISDVTITGAVASWEPMGTERSWAVFVADTIITNFSGLTVDTAYTYTYALANLEPDKNYWFYVQPLCGANWKSVPFRTLPTCPAPIDLSVSGITNESATLRWNDALSVGSAYVVAYGPAATFNLSDTTTYKTVPAAADSIVLTGLNAQTNYAFAVKTVCSATSVGSYSDIVTFRTDCGAITQFPWTDDFEAYATDILTDPCWTNEHISGSGSQLFKIYATTIGDNATNKLQLPDQAVGTLTELKLPTMILPDSNYQLVLDVYRSNSTYNTQNIYEGVRIFVSTNGELAGAKEITFVPRQYNTSSSKIPAETVVGWYTYELPLGVSGQCNIILQGESQFCTSTYMDNFRVEAIPTCQKLESVTVTNIASDEASFAWVKAAANQTQFQYVCVPFGVEPDWDNATITDSLTATVSDLEVATSYTFYVRAYCSADDQSAEISTTFFTACGVISTLPWNEGFEAFEGGSYSSSSADFVPPCWQVSTGGTVAPHVTTAGSYSFVHSGSKSLTFYGDSTGLAILPQFDASLDALQMSFYYRTYSAGSSSGVLALCYVSWSDSSLHLIDTYEPTTEFTKVKINLDTLPSTADQLAFWYSGGNSSYSAYLYTVSVDDIHIDSINYNCMGIKNFHMTSFSMAGATFEWEFAGGVNNAEIQVAADADFTEIFDQNVVLNATSYVVSGLQSASTYYARVRQACGDGEFSDWSSVVAFSTPSYSLPYIPTMSSTEPDDWFFSNTKISDAFNGVELNPYVSSSDYSGWSKTPADTVINDYHFRGNIWGTTWNYWAVTPAIDMTNNVGEGVVLSFDAGLVAFSSTKESAIYTGVDDRFLVAVSIDGGASWQAANVAAEWNNAGTGDFVYNEVPRVGTTYRINMSDYTGHVVKIGFYGESTVANADNYFHFGNVRLETVETTNYSDTLCEGYSFNKNGFNIPYDQLHIGLNTFSRYEINPDNTIALTIQQVLVNASSVFEIPVTLCEGEHYNDYGFDVTATVSQNVRKRIDGGNQFGCDSTVILQMTVIPTVRAEIHVGCNTDSYTWHGKTYYQSTIVNDTTSSLVTGCDSITTLYLTMCEPTTYSYFNAFCEGGSYSDEFFDNLTMPGHYSTTVTDELGCETHANVTLRALKSGQDYVDSVHVSKLPYVLGNDTLCPETDQPGFVYHGSKDFGCGLVNVTIYVYDKVALDNIAAGTLQVAPNPVRIGEDIRILTSIGFTSDYSCRVFDAVGKLVYESFEPATTIPGLPVAGAYTIRISAGNTIYQGKLIVK